MSRKGRPLGAKNVTQVQTVEASRCRHCQSTERAPYGSERVQPFAGLLTDGTPYTHIVRKPTRCRTCGRNRIDRSYENRIAAEEIDQPDEEIDSSEEK